MVNIHYPNGQQPKREYNPQRDLPTPHQSIYAKTGECHWKMKLIIATSII